MANATAPTYTCPDCNREHSNRSGHRQCSRCMHAARRHPCADCGKPVSEAAEVCQPCWGARHAGDQNPAWNGGRYVDTLGYVRIHRPDHPRASSGYVYEHVLVAEATLGRPLTDDEIVHHLNGTKDDNRDENLRVMSRSEHAAHHRDAATRRFTS